MRQCVTMLLYGLLLVACSTPQPANPTAVPAVPTATQQATVRPTAVPATPTSLPQPTVATEPVPLTLTSSAFSEGQPIPIDNTCDGANTSPALAWDTVPEGTQSLALIMEDPDADNYTHWVLFNIPPETRELAAAIADGEQLEGIGMHAQNAFATPGYGGPCPPIDANHTYVFTLYALNTRLDLNPSPLEPVSKGMVRELFKGHVLGEGRLTGTYQRR